MMNLTLPASRQLTPGRGAVETLADCGLDYVVEKRPLFLGDSTPAWGDDGAGEVVTPTSTPAGKYRALCRGDDVFGVVTESYEPVQNRDIAELLDAALQHAGLPLAAAGARDRGRLATWWVDLGSFTLPGNDRNANFARVDTGHGGASAIILSMYTWRLVCSNGMIAWVPTAIGKLRHTSNAMERLPQMLRALSHLEREAQKWAGQAQQLAERRMTQSEVRDFFLEAYRRITKTDVRQLDPSDRKRERAMQVVSAWLVNLQDERQSLQGNGNTAWTAMNAVTQWAIHERTVRRGNGQTESEARASSVLDGEAGKAATIAHDLALELI